MRQIKDDDVPFRGDVKQAKEVVELIIATNSLPIIDPDDPNIKTMIRYAAYSLVQLNGITYTELLGGWTVNKVIIAEHAMIDQWRIKAQDRQMQSGLRKTMKRARIPK